MPIGIKMTRSLSGKFILMEFNDYKTYYSKVKLRISEIRSICKMVDKEGNPIGVQVIFASHNSEIFQKEWFADVNGVTDFSTDEKLWAEFDKIIDPPVV